jgi:UDP-N-acetylglucosamine 3-dehydrogenase
VSAPRQVNTARQLSFGVIGLGFGANHARVLDELPGARLAAVCDPDKARLEAAARGRETASYLDHAEMLCKEKLDAVIVAVPASLHLEVASAAIAAGCAVLVEKPLAPSLAEGMRLVETAAAAGVALMPGHIERFNPAVQELARRVQAGEIGRVLHVTARRMGAIVVRAQDVNVVHDSALHDIDVMRYVLDAEVERVFAEGRTDLDMAFEDSITALLRFAPTFRSEWSEIDGGDVGQMRVNAIQQTGPGATATLDVNWLAPRLVRDLTVRGSEGVFVLDYAAQTLDLFHAKSLDRPGSRGWQPASDAIEALRIAVEPKEPLLQEISAFVASLRDGAPMPVTPADALAALSVCDALTESARTARPVAPQRIQA